MSMTDTAGAAKRVPALRFPEFEGEWSELKFSEFLTPNFRDVPKPSENYLAIGIRSHGKGTFQKPNSDPDKISMDTLYVVHENDLIVNITFAWEGAIAIVPKEDKGGHVSHRFPTYEFERELVSHDYFRSVIADRRFRQKLELISPGGAGRNRVMSKPEFLKLRHRFPSLSEQKKIAAFLGVVDTKIAGLKARQEGLERYKRGLMQALFSQRLRFTKPDGTGFPDWEEKRLGEFLELSRKRVPASTDIPVYSSARDGLKPQKDYFADRELSNEGEYGVVPKGYIVYRHMSDDLTFKFNINDTGHEISVSKEYPVFTTKGMDVRYLRMWLNNSNEFARFAAMQKLGGTRTRLYFKTLQSWCVKIPHPDEQQKIADALQAMDVKIAAVAGQVAKMEEFKKGLLQQMFV